MINKEDRAIIRKIINKATSGRELSQRLLAALPHLDPIAIRDFMDSEVKRIQAREHKRNVAQAAFEQAVQGTLAEFAKHPVGTTLGDPMDMQQAKRGRH